MNYKIVHSVLYELDFLALIPKARTNFLSALDLDALVYFKSVPPIMHTHYNTHAFVCDNVHVYRAIERT